MAKETIDDINTAYTRTTNHGISFFYISETTANSPTDGGIGFVVSYRHDAYYGLQVVYGINGIFKREMENLAWSNWHQIAL